MVFNRGKGAADMNSPEHVNITCIICNLHRTERNKALISTQRREEVPGILFFSLALLFLFFEFYHPYVHCRHRKQRGEVSLTVGSSETLRDVKVQVKQIFFFFFLIIFPGGRVPRSIFAGYVPLSSKNPYPLYSILWPIIDPILVGKGEKKRN